MNDDWKTADELMAELEAKPEFQMRMTEKAQRRAERKALIAQIEEPLLAELRELGIDVRYVSELCQPENVPVSPEVVSILLKWLPLVSHDRVKDAIIRAVGASREPFDGKPLVECFLADRGDESLRWPIANTMAVAKPTGIADWLAGAVRERRYGTARQLLFTALARHAKRDVALPILRELVDEMPGHIAMALARIGDSSDADMLESRRDRGEAWERKEIDKAVRKIRKRAESKSDRRK